MASQVNSVPRFSFADTLAQQQAQLAGNPLLERFASSRRQKAGDSHRPVYHFAAPDGGLNDPNGLCFWKGQWHLFYQSMPPGSHYQHWGHAFSDDLIHWRDLPYAIYPGPEEGSWSGSTLVEDRRVIAMYHGQSLGNMVAVSGDDLLLNWTKVGSGPAIPMFRRYFEPLTAESVGDDPIGKTLPVGSYHSVYDPCIWKKDGVYYSLSGGALPHAPSGRRLREEFLFRSTDLVKWEYMHPFLEGDVFGLVGDDGACPYFWPIGDRHILLHFSHMGGGRYLLGDYDTRRDKFVVSSGGAFTFGPCMPGGVLAPSATPDGRGGVVTIFHMASAIPEGPTDMFMTLPRRLTLIAKDELGIEPAGDIESLRGEHSHVAPMSLPANREVVLDAVRGAAMELSLEIDPREATMVELNVLRSPDKMEYTRIAFFRQRGYYHPEQWATFLCDWGSLVPEGLLSIDTSYSSLRPEARCRAPETAPVYLAPGETLKLRVFIDKSVVEVFANGRQVVAVRVYPSLAESVGISLRAQGQDATLSRLDAWQMKSIY